MNPEVLRFVSALVPLRDEPLIAYHGYLWDGRTLATQVEAGGDEEDRFLLPYELSDFDILHEAAHHFVADPVEREFPDYGCTLAVDQGSTGGIQGMALHKVIDGVLTPAEQDWREVCAYFLGLHWAMHFGVEIPDASQMGHPKNAYMGMYGDTKRGWQALIYLQEHGLLS